MLRAPASPLRVVAASVALVVASIALAGCGHPASQEECEAIIAKSTELELHAQNVTDPETIAQRLVAVKTARGDELLKRCVGKRITKNALLCIERASTPRDLDKCLD